MNKFYINKREYIIENTLENNSFVGIKIINNEYYLCFPLGFKVKRGTETYYKKILRYLYKTVLLTKSIENIKDDVYESNNDKVIPINSYIYLLSDYFANGTYKYNEVKYKLDNKGKINWKRTFRNNFYVQNKAPIYLDTIVRYNKKEHNIISLLQLYCVNKAIDMLVFLGDFHKPYSELTDQDISNNINYYNNLIDKELKNTNNDKKKLLLNHIKNIINDCNCSSHFIRSFGTINYHYSFEKMINKLFGNINNLKEFYPTSLWYLDKDEEGFESSKLREDTIWKGKDLVYIIDSKYYRYGILEYNNDLLPNTSTIYKQIVYGDYVFKKLQKKDKKKYKIYNIFIIPSDRDNFLEYKGYAKMKLLDDDQKFKKVYLLFINMNDLMDKYFNKDFNQIDKMIEIIEKNK